MRKTNAQIMTLSGGTMAFTYQVKDLTVILLPMPIICKYFTGNLFGTRVLTIRSNLPKAERSAIVQAVLQKEPGATEFA